MYPPLVKMAGGQPVLIDTHPDFRMDLDKVEPPSRHKTDFAQFSGQSTGVTPSKERLSLQNFARSMASLCCPMIYSHCCGDRFESPAEVNPIIVIDGFSKSHATRDEWVGCMARRQSSKP